MLFVYCFLKVASHKPIYFLSGKWALVSTIAASYTTFGTRQFLTHRTALFNQTVTDLVVGMLDVKGKDTVVVGNND